jgi:hypothetical protein
MNATDNAPITTKAARVLELDPKGAGLPRAAVDLFHELEVREHEINTDSKLSDSYRRDLRQQLHDDIDRRLHASGERALVDARKPLEQERAQILNEIRGTTARADFNVETSDAQRERLGRQTIEELAFNSELATVGLRFTRPAGYFSSDRQSDPRRSSRMWSGPEAEPV